MNKPTLEPTLPPVDGAAQSTPASTRKRRLWAKLLVATLLACALAPWVHTASRAAKPAAAATPSASTPSFEWPATWDGKTLRPMAMSAIEQRFALRFPGSIARFTDDEQRVLVLRHVTQPTRMLHPAADCFRGLGYQISNQRLVRATPPAASAQRDQPPMTRCFDAERDGQRLRVCENIVGVEGDSYTDTSSWFWAASMGKSKGPWQAATVVEAL